MIRYPSRLLFVTSLSIGALAFRARHSEVQLQAIKSGPSVDRAHTQSARVWANTSNPSGEAPPLKIFSSSWNAYNRIWSKASDADDMISMMVDGHEEADLVMIGFQEYYDEAKDGESVAKRMQDQLWKGVFAEKAMPLHQLPHKEIPPEVFKAKQDILLKFQAFHAEVEKALHSVSETFGSPSASSEHFTSSLKSSLEKVDTVLQTHNQKDYDEHFEKINTWAQTLRDEHRNFLKLTPNFQLDTPGQEQHRAFTNTFMKAPTDAYNSLDNRYDNAKAKIQGMLTEVESEAARVTAEKVADIQNYMNSWLQDVNTYVGRVAEKSPLDLQHEDLVVHNFAEIFDGDTQFQKRKSTCHGWPANHYNTDLRIFANPWSKWKYVQRSIKKYSIDYNGVSESWTGTDGQCGKGVNVVKLRLQAYTGHQVNVCMLNAHQSFKYPFLHRLYNMQDTLESLSGNHKYNSDDLACDMVVFTADFNTRLMCKPQQGDLAGLTRALPDTPASPTGGDTGNSFQSIMNTFCKAGKCSLSSNEQNAQADELVQFLKNEKLNCFEYTKKSKDIEEEWTLHTDVDNVLWPMGVSDGRLREAGPPNFGPTYKLVREKDKGAYGAGDKKYAGWSQCLPLDRHVCLFNKDRDFKHNPAWTDRILVRDSEKAQINTDLYERRTFVSQACHKNQDKPDTCSDHAIVTAKLSVTVS